MPKVTDSLDTILCARGAVMTRRGGVRVPAHFGSAAGELAACVLGVGVANRCDLGKVLLSGPPGALRALLRRHTGMELAPGGALAGIDGWWCAGSTDRLLVLAAPELRTHLHASLRQEAARLGITVIDASGTLASVAVAGRRLHHLLAALTLVPGTADLCSVAPYSAADVAGHHVNLLLESNHRAVLITDAVQATNVWQAIETAGRPLGLSLIGIEALERFAMFDDMCRRRTVAA